MSNSIRPITGANVWHGKDMAQSPRWQRRLSPAQLAEIDAALERLYKRPDEYGRCERTGKPIPFKRLDLVPWARTCD